jgi:hypothetical protein
VFYAPHPFCLFILSLCLAVDYILPTYNMQPHTQI